VRFVAYHLGKDFGHNFGECLHAGRVNVGRMYHEDICGCTVGRLGEPLPTLPTSGRERAHPAPPATGLHAPRRASQNSPSVGQLGSTSEGLNRATSEKRDSGGPTENQRESVYSSVIVGVQTMEGKRRNTTGVYERLEAKKNKLAELEDEVEQKTAEVERKKAEAEQELERKKAEVEQLKAEVEHLARAASAFLTTSLSSCTGTSKRQA